MLYFYKQAFDDLNSIHFPSGKVNSPLVRLELHSEETLQLVNKPGFYLVNLIPTSTTNCSLLLMYGGTGIYNFAAFNGTMDSRIIYLNTNSYKIITTGSIQSCYIYDQDNKNERITGKYYTI